MARVERTIQQFQCDFCGKVEPYHMSDCRRCHRHVCYECKRAGAAVEYTARVYSGGSEDGVYCNDCDAALRASPGTDKAHQAYRRIASLRHEYDGWHSDFNGRREAAEKALENLL